MLRYSGLRRVKLQFKLKDGSIKSVDAPAGISILKAAHMFEVELEGACEESLACSTCHVILEDNVFKKIPKASEREEDLLDLAPSLTATSRLGCQVQVNQLLEGAVITLPKTTVNFYVDGHVPKPH
jgi:ferredoxin-2, mitochondrial